MASRHKAPSEELSKKTAHAMALLREGFVELHHDPSLALDASWLWKIRQGLLSVAAQAEAEQLTDEGILADLNSQLGEYYLWCRSSAVREKNWLFLQSALGMAYARYITPDHDPLVFLRDWLRDCEEFCDVLAVDELLSYAFIAETAVTRDLADIERFDARSGVPADVRFLKLRSRKLSRARLWLAPEEVARAADQWFSDFSGREGHYEDAELLIANTAIVGALAALELRDFTLAQQFVLRTEDFGCLTSLSRERDILVARMRELGFEEIADKLAKNYG